MSKDAPVHELWGSRFHRFASRSLYRFVLLGVYSEMLVLLHSVASDTDKRQSTNLIFLQCQASFNIRSFPAGRRLAGGQILKLARSENRVKPGPDGRFPAFVDVYMRQCICSVLGSMPEASDAFSIV